MKHPCADLGPCQMSSKSLSFSVTGECDVNWLRELQPHLYKNTKLQTAMLTWLFRQCAWHDSSNSSRTVGAAMAPSGWTRRRTKHPANRQSQRALLTPAGCWCGLRFVVYFAACPKLRWLHELKCPASRLRFDDAPAHWLEHLRS